MAVIYGIYKKHCYAGRISLYLVEARMLRPMFKLGGYMYALQMTNTLAEKSNPLIISSFFGPTGVALYQSGGKVCQMLRPIVMTFVNQLYPLTTQCHVLNQETKQKKIFLSGTKYTMLFGVLVAIGVFVYAEPFCKLWLSKELGNDYFKVAYIMQLLAIVDLTAYARGTQWPILLGMKKLKFLVWAQLPSAVLNVFVSIYLVGYTDLGLAGVVYPTIVLNLLRLPVLIWYVGKQMNVSFAHCIKESYLRPAICLALTFIGAKVVHSYIGCNTWLELVFAGVATSCVWVGSLLFVGANQQERSQLIEYGMKWMIGTKT
jgi:O-antigen/teichoic acid export membrane protein